MNTQAQEVAGAEHRRGSLFTRLRSYFVYVPLVYLYTLVLGILSLLSSLFDRSGRVQHWFARLWSRMILKTGFVPVHRRGAGEHRSVATRGLCRQPSFGAGHSRALRLTFPGSSASWRRKSCSATRCWAGT